MAIPARMPMIKMTTRSSTRVKPCSLSARLRSFESIDPPGIGGYWACQIPGPLSHPGSQSEPPVAARLPLKRGPWLCVPPSRVVCLWHLLALAASVSAQGEVDDQSVQPDLDTCANRRQTALRLELAGRRIAPRVEPAGRRARDRSG